MNDLYFDHSGTGLCLLLAFVTVTRVVWAGRKSSDGAVDVKQVEMMRRPVGLKEMKKDDELKGWGMFRQSRLLVVPVSQGIWGRVCDLGGGLDGDARDEEEAQEEAVACS